MSSNMTSESDGQVILETILHELITLDNEYRIVRAMWIMSLALVLYDYTLTFADEVNYIWRGRFVWTHVLFYINRYWPMANLIFDNIVFAVGKNSDQKLCHFWINFLAYAQIPFEISICTVYIMRLYAMYGCNRKFLVLLWFIYSFVLVSENTIIGIAMHDAKFEPVPLPGLTGCLPTGIKPYAWTFWIPMLTFESILLLLSLFRSIQLINEERKAPNIVVVLLRDSVIYFGGVVLAIVANLVGWMLGGNVLFAAFFPLAIMAFSILGSRMLLNIHGVADPSYRREYWASVGAEQTLEPTTNTAESYQLQSMQFQQRSILSVASEMAITEPDLDV